ncbi:thioredoxin domain-containing protein [Streptomyces sp. VRA16 Mangrove soil]|uniref:DsbA family protein n=1 Tax=Streptomyces sp. VRA16 Mangrove soil TaxID=2817434 RepID=UPI001A9E3708|nr:thioredoxin domain-containing protein [Streptomyces sp. VRA16 Mangrove soil]MBO1333469.1 thioredoxin domain-containing protein [Streptomyces sp. VRA16 Mangrove soil]
MSEKNREGKRAARERLAAEREKQKAAEKRRRTLIVGAAVVCVLGLAAVIGVVAANSGGDSSSDTSSGPVVAPQGAVGDDKLAIPVGKDTAKPTLTIWEDFRCPACQSFETNYRSTLHELVDAGTLKIQYHLVTLIDSNMGGTGSLRAGNAAACAQDAGKFRDYHDVLYENQPEESDDAFAKNSKLIELAGTVDGLVTDTFKSCVNDGKHDSWVQKSYKKFQDDKLSGTPTVILDGTTLDLNTLTPDKLKQQVEAAAK